MYENLEFDLDLKLLFMALCGHIMKLVNSNRLLDGNRNRDANAKNVVV